ncbi:hypothetical protein BGZ94_005718 [Podila epigama]|nr:hypothetical protein BGZ94_005718 [Podila epigama]
MPMVLPIHRPSSSPTPSGTHHRSNALTDANVDAAAAAAAVSETVSALARTNIGQEPSHQRKNALEEMGAQEPRQQHDLINAYSIKHGFVPEGTTTGLRTMAVDIDIPQEDYNKNKSKSLKHISNSGYGHLHPGTKTIKGGVNHNVREYLDSMPESREIFKAKYSGVPVFEMRCGGVAVMKRRSDSYLNATQILKVARFDKPSRTRILEREVQTGPHEKVQGGYGKYQGTWVPFERGLSLCKEYNVDKMLQPLLDYSMAEKSPPLAPKHITAASFRMMNISDPQRRKHQKATKMTTSKPSTPGPIDYSPRASEHPPSVYNTFDGEHSATELELYATYDSHNNQHAYLSDASMDETMSLLSVRSRTPSPLDNLPGVSPMMTSEHRFHSPQPHHGSFYSESSPQPPRQRTVSGENHSMDYHSQRADINPRQDLLNQDRYATLGDHLAPPGRKRGRPPSRKAEEEGLKAFKSSHPIMDSGSPSRNSPVNSSPRNSSRPSPKSLFKTLGDRGSDGGVEDRQRQYADVLLQYFISDSCVIPRILYDPPVDLDFNLVIDDEGHTPLHWAVAMARTKIVRMLVRNGADIFRVNDKGQTALMRSVMFVNNFEQKMFPTLLEVLQKTIFTIDNNNMTVFHHVALTLGMRGKVHACRYYMECLVEKLIRYPSELASIINIQDSFGDTALTIAARFGNKKIIRLLTDAGADRMIRNRSGMNADDYMGDMEPLDIPLPSPLLTTSVSAFDSVTATVTGTLAKSPSGRSYPTHDSLPSSLSPSLSSSFTKPNSHHSQQSLQHQRLQRDSPRQQSQPQQQQQAKPQLFQHREEGDRATPIYQGPRVTSQQSPLNSSSTRHPEQQQQQQQRGRSISTESPRMSHTAHHSSSASGPVMVSSPHLHSHPSPRLHQHPSHLSSVGRTSTPPPPLQSHNSGHLRHHSGGAVMSPGNQISYHHYASSPTHGSTVMEGNIGSHHKSSREQGNELDYRNNVESFSRQPIPSASYSYSASGGRAKGEGPASRSSDQISHDRYARQGHDHSKQQQPHDHQHFRDPHNESQGARPVSKRLIPAVNELFQQLTHSYESDLHDREQDLLEARRLLHGLEAEIQENKEIIHDMRARTAGLSEAEEEIRRLEAQIRQEVDIRQRLFMEEWMDREEARMKERQDEGSSSHEQNRHQYQHQASFASVEGEGKGEEQGGGGGEDKAAASRCAALEKEAAELRMTLTHYQKQRKEQVEQLIQLKGGRCKRQNEYKRLIALCCNVSIDEVDELLDPLLRVISDELNDEIEDLGTPPPPVPTKSLQKGRESILKSSSNKNKAGITAASSSSSSSFSSGSRTRTTAAVPSVTKRRGVVEDDSDEDIEHEEDTPRFKPETMHAIFKGVWANPETRVQKDALKLSAEFLRLFTIEALHRTAAYQREQDSDELLRDDEMLLDIDSLEAITPQLLMDF